MTCSRQPPAELLGDLVADGLGALGVEGPEGDVDEAPVLVLERDLAAEPVDVVVVALDRDQRAAVDRGVDGLAVLEVVRDEYDGADAGASRRRRDRAGEVAGRRAGHRGQPEGVRCGHGDRDDAVLERVRRVAAVVLDPQPAHPERGGEVVGAVQPGPARAEVGRPGGRVGGHGQQRRVAPDGLRSGLDLLPGHGAEVVADLERPEALLAGIAGAELVSLGALAADKCNGWAEGTGAGCRVDGHDITGVDAQAGHGRGLSPHLSRGRTHGTDLAPGANG